MIHSMERSRSRIVRGTPAQFSRFVASAAILAALAASPAAAVVTYVDGTWGAGGNTTYLDGSVFTPAGNGAAVDNLWKERTGGTNFGHNNTIMESNGNSGAASENSPMLRTTITGLLPNTEYNIFGYFWSQTSGTQDWKLKATLDALLVNDNGTPGDVLDDSLPTALGTSYSKFGSAVAPVATNAPAVAGGFDGSDNLGASTNANGLSTSYFTNATKVRSTDNTLAMFQASLGQAISDGSGQVNVYIDDLANQATSNNRTWYDGVGFELPGQPILTINRQTGAAVFTTGVARDTIGYSIVSPSGALTQTGWNTITGNYDAPPGGDGTIDSNDTWIKLTNPASTTDLSEAELGETGPLDGAILPANLTLDFGPVWRKHYIEDVEMRIARNDVNGTIDTIPVVYIGNGGAPFPKGDFNFSGTVNKDDYAIFISNLFGNVPNSQAAAYALGDITGDIAVNYDDLVAFRSVYNGANGSGAFEALMGGEVPEPSALAILGCLASIVLVSRRRSDRHGFETRRGIRHQRVLSALAALVVLGASSAQSQTFYLDANHNVGGNTTRLDGTAVTVTNVNGQGPADDQWNVRVQANLSTIYETNANGSEDAHMLLTTISGLAPNAQYNIYGYFWSNPAENWRLKATVHSQDISDNGTPGDQSDDFLGNVPAYSFSSLGSQTTTTAPLAVASHFATPVVLTGTNLAMYEASLGAIAADATGKVNVYIDDLENQGSSINRTWFDGVGYERITPLTLQVSTVSGATRLINKSGVPVTFKYYQITSPMSSLNAAGWLSLDTQNIDAVDGNDPGTTAGDSLLEGWDAAGEADNDTLGEVKYNSASTLANGAYRTLGLAFQPGHQQDLDFKFEIGGRLRPGEIEYVTAFTPILPGDYDGNGFVQVADYTKWRSTFGSTSTLDADGNGNQIIDAADYTIWRNAFDSNGAGASLGASPAVPEPSAALLALLAAVGAAIARKPNRTPAASGIKPTLKRNCLVNAPKMRMACGIAALLFIAGNAGSAIADVFPNPLIPQNSSSGTNRMNGLKRSLYYVVHDADDPFTPAEWDTRVNAIRAKELVTRDFFAESSGGRFDLYYAQVIDTPINLNADGTRPSDWVTQSNAVATGTYGLNLSDYYMYAYDVNQTTADPDQGWGGLSTGDRIYLQSIGQNVTNHEIGHRISADHGKAIVARNDANYHPYTWNVGTQAYEPYVPGVSPFHSTPFGAASFEYGNPFDTMGNISGGHFRIREKLEDLGWLTSAQVPRLDGASGLGPGTYKIYAHDGLQSTTDVSGNYGVVNTYNPSVLYGLTYNRAGQRFSTTTSNWVNETQIIDIEYRTGADGAAFYLNGALIDLDSEGGTSNSNTERLLEIGKSVEDTAFGMSNFFAPAGAIGGTPTGEDFITFNPPPPVNVAGKWFHFSALSTGVDAIGGFLNLLVTEINPLNGIVGDLNQDTFVNTVDINLFVAGWLADTSSMSSIDKYLRGDINLNGLTDLPDAFLMNRALKANGVGSGLPFGLLGVPEPSTMTLLAIAAAALLGRRRQL